MKKFIEDCMGHFQDSIIEADGKCYRYVEMLSQIKIHAIKLKNRMKCKVKCAILCKSEFNTAMGLLSCLYAGMVAIPLSFNYGKDHYEKVLEFTEPDILITDVVDFQYQHVYNLCLSEFFGSCVCNVPEEILSDISLIMCTSGTTGKPKGALITTVALQKNIKAINKYFGLSTMDTILIARPLYHCAVLTGEFLISLSVGAHIVFLNSKYNPNLLVTYLQRFAITVFCGTPTMLSQISRLVIRSKPVPSIKKIAISGECLTPKAAHLFLQAFPGVNIYNVYGLTEASPRVSFLPPELFKTYYCSVGIPIDGVSIKIVDKSTGEEQSAGKIGNVMVSSPSLMKSYYREVELTKKMICSEWLDTNDIGYKDLNGLLYILGRADGMIIKAGMNIFPCEIEDKVNQLDEIDECVAYSITKEYGHDIALDVLLVEKRNLEIKELRMKLKTVLPDYLMPTKVQIVNSIPKNASGKIIRKK